MAAASNRGLVALFKRGWNEIPEIIGACFMGVIGLGLCAASLKVYYDKDADNRRHKLAYTVIRHDDPLAQRLNYDKYDSKN